MRTILKEQLLELAVSAAKAAGQITLDFFQKKFEIEFKDEMSNNIVTEVDKKAEKCIIDMIKSKYPDHSILAEESGETSSESNYKWIIDPLDGTVNYAHGVPVYSVSIAAEKDGEVIAGVVYDPTRNDMFTAVKDGGAYLNGTKISVSSHTELYKSLLVTGFPYNVRENPGNCVGHFVNFLYESRAIRRFGSAALDCCWVACGRFDGFYEVALKPWDVAAGALLVTEAGGKVTNFFTESYSVYEKSLLATNGKIHEQMMNVLRRK
jgi:myo-inositol-1(or 4)-monophosphatase